MESQVSVKRREKGNSREVKVGRWPVNPISAGKKDGVIRRG